MGAVKETEICNLREFATSLLGTVVSGRRFSFSGQSLCRGRRLKPSVLLELASHASMGVALGLTFALILTLTPAFGVSALIALGSNPHDILLTFVGTCALMFGVGATLTGLVFKLTEDMP